ncbi:nuclear pore complex protein Nup214 isoform X3 [Poecilia reticulata]|uniref:nuclear pore complex protein Nup214 isoform X3 n=1 Tax=Poecilia reticulata TaxID=8081 RepID=UPI0004A2A4C3|nr:PREDICTED: nuclear pore complex protein Nup214 isoform X3 [Poecilia reticulata]
MGDDADTPPEREMKDFQFRQMKKVQVFEAVEDMPKDRSSLLTVSNKYGLTFVGLGRTFKVYLTLNILAADKADGNSYEVVKGIPAMVEVTGDMSLHHLALSCDELTLSVCGTSEETGLSIAFYDVRTFINKARPQKLPFASLQPAVASDALVQDLKWNPAQPSMLAACLSDGSMMILEVTGDVKIQAQLPANSGVTCLSWSPKGKQVAVGKMNATVSQYTPALEEKRVIPCPPFYNSDDPVKALDVLWLRTPVFAVAYAYADGCLETPPELVLISLPKKDEKVEPKYLNFGESVFGSCTERQHHYFLSHIEDWDLMLAASAASIEVSVIARQDDRMWEVWLLEDASRAELPVTETNDDTLPLGLAIDYTSQQEIQITDEKTLPPAPTMLMLSTEGVLCPFALLNLNPGVKQLVSPFNTITLEGERQPNPGSSAAQPAKTAASAGYAPTAFSNIALASVSSASSAPPASSSAVPFSFVPAVPVSSSSSEFTFSVPTTHAISTVPPAFSLGGSGPFSSVSSNFSFASKPPSETPSAASAFSFSTPSIKPAAAAPASTPQSLPAASLPSVKLNLNDRFTSGESPAPAFSFNSTLPKAAVASSSAARTLSFPATKPPVVLTPVRPVQMGTPPTAVQKPAPTTPGRSQPPQATVGMKSLEKQLQQKKESDPIMTGILEEIAHFQKELDDLKSRSTKADFKVGTNDEMKDLRKESEDLHIFTLEIKETTESLHGDIGTLKTTLIEGFAGAEEAKTQSELSKDKNYRQLLYKKSLDPRSEEQLKEIRRLYQYVTCAVEDVNDVLDVEWEKHLEKKKKQKHMVVPGREGLFTTLSNNIYIINQQKNRLNQLVQELTSLHLYSKNTAPFISQNIATGSTAAGFENELESLKDAFLKARLDVTPPKVQAKSSAVKISPVKQSQLRNFLSKGQMPPVRSTAPANLSRSVFLSPKYYEDLDDASSTSSLSQSLEPHLDQEEEELQPLQPPAVMALSTPRHPTVVRTPSIHPGFGGIQSTPLPKIHSAPSLGFGLSPIPSPVPTNKINLSGADSTALATKTVKHGAPPAERTVPVTMSAQQAAANAAMRRQMANQKTAPANSSLTESTLKTVPQVVNVQELIEKGLPVQVPSIISSSVPDLTNQAFANQVKRTTTPGIQKISNESTYGLQPGFVFGQSSKTDVSGVPASSVEPSISKPFSFTPGSAGFPFPSISQGAGMTQVKDVSKFSFGGNGKMVFGQTAEEPFSLTPKSVASGIGTGSPTLSLSTSGEAAKHSSLSTAFRMEPQPPKTSGGETLGCFSGLRVGPGEEVKDTVTKPAAAFTFGEPGLGIGKGVQSFSFVPGLQKPAEDSGTTDLSKGASSSSLFKPPETNSKPAFALPPSSAAPSAMPTSFSSLLAGSSEEPKAPPQLSEPTPPPEKEPSTTEPFGESANQSVAPEPAVDSSSTPAPPALTTATTQDLPSANVAPAEATPPPASFVPFSTEATPYPPSTSSVSTPAAPTMAPVSQGAPPGFQVPISEKPGSIFTQPAPAPAAAPVPVPVPAPATTDSSSIGATPVINTAAPAATTITTTTVTPAPITTANTVFGQPAAPPASSAPSATGFGSTGFGASTGAGFNKSMFGQSGFGQPASSAGSSSGFSFTQSAFGPSSSSATTGGTNLFGASTAGSAHSFSFGSGSTNTASSTGSGLFGQSAAPAFGQSSGFGQPSGFGSNTTTSSSSGFSFGQTSGFGCSGETPIFGQPTVTGRVFGQPSSGSSLFGSASANAAGSSSGGFFSGLGGKPSEDAANKNPFGATASTGGFGQPAQSGSNNLFGNSGAKAFGFGQSLSAFGDQKPSGTFSTGAGSVASQGFGSFSSPTKPGCFGSPPVFGSPPSFGGSPAFGGTASFGTSPSFTNPMIPSAGKVFGEGTAASNMGGFGFSSAPSGPSFGALASQTAPSFGTLAQQGSAFGSQPSSFSGFGQQPQTGGFSGNTFGSASHVRVRARRRHVRKTKWKQQDLQNRPSSQTFSSWRS